MNESKIRGLKWNLKKVRGPVLHFSLESMIVEYKQQAYDADLKESELKIVEDELRKMELRRIQELGITCETTKEEKEDDNRKYIYMCMMADIDARTGVGKIEI